MVAVICLLVFCVILIVAMFITIDYLNHCIDDLYQNIKRIKRRKNEEFVGILNHIQECQNYEPATRDTQVRRVVNEAIERYADENRKFETLLSLSCEEYIKKELNTKL